MLTSLELTLVESYLSELVDAIEATLPFNIRRLRSITSTHCTQSSFWKKHQNHPAFVSIYAIGLRLCVRVYTYTIHTRYIYIYIHVSENFDLWISLTEISKVKAESQPTTFKKESRLKHLSNRTL